MLWLASSYCVQDDILRLSAKFSFRIYILSALLVAAALLLTSAAALIYTAVSPPNEITMLAPADQLSGRKTPEPEIFRFKDGVAPEQAAILNAAVPEDASPVEAALPLSVQNAKISAQSKFLAIDCLTAAIYYEAASESVDGQQAVAQVILNRIRHPAYPNSVCGVVFQGSQRSTGCQFSFTCDGSMARRPSKNGWVKAQAIASMALAGHVETAVGLATHYHTVWVVPYWSGSLTKLRTIGAHIFYRWAGINGTRRAFTNKYSGLETMPQMVPSDIKLDRTTVIEALPTQPGGALSLPGLLSAPAAKSKETGLMITPEARLKTSDNASQQKSESSKNNALIVDQYEPVASKKSNTLLIDRK